MRKINWIYILNINKQFVYFADLFNSKSEVLKFIIEFLCIKNYVIIKNKLGLVFSKLFVTPFQYINKTVSIVL